MNQTDLELDVEINRWAPRSQQVAQDREAELRASYPSHRGWEANRLMLFGMLMTLKELHQHNGSHHHGIRAAEELLAVWSSSWLRQVAAMFDSDMTLEERESEWKEIIASAGTLTLSDVLNEFEDKTAACPNEERNGRPA